MFFLYCKYFRVEVFFKFYLLTYYILYNVFFFYIEERELVDFEKFFSRDFEDVKWFVWSNDLRFGGNGYIAIWLDVNG